MGMDTCAFQSKLKWLSSKALKGRLWSQNMDPFTFANESNCELIGLQTTAYVNRGSTLTLMQVVYTVPFAFLIMFAMSISTQYGLTFVIVLECSKQTVVLIVLSGMLTNLCHLEHMM
jgi:hypothetical protein